MKSLATASSLWLTGAMLLAGLGVGYSESLARISTDLPVVVTVSASRNTEEDDGNETLPLANSASAIDLHLIAGRRALDLADFASARIEFEKALKISPTDARAYFFLGRLASAQQNNNDAIEYYRQALAHHGNYASAAINLGLLLNRTERYAEAIPVLEIATQLSSGTASAKASYALAKAQYELADFNSARAAVERSIQFRPQFARAWALKGEILAALGESQPAFTALAQALKTDTKDATVWMYQAKAQQRFDNPRAAITSAKRAIALDQNLDEARLVLANAYRVSGATERARQQFKKLAARFREHPDRYYYQGELALLGGDDEDALRQFKRIDGKAGLGDIALRRIAEVQIRQGRLKSALATLDDLIKSHPNDALLWNDRGRVLLRQRKYRAAKEALGKATQLAPQLSNPWFNLARANTQLNDLKLAITQYQRSIELNDSQAARLNLGVLLRRTNQFTQARAVYSELLEQHPNYTAARFNLALLEAANNRTEQAAIHYERLLQGEPEHRAALLNLAVIRFRQGQHNDAQGHLLQLLAQSPADSAARFNLALVLEAKGASAEAAAELKRLLAIDETYQKGWSALGRVARQLNDLPAALHALQRACVLAARGDASADTGASAASDDSTMSAQCRDQIRARNPDFALL